MFKTKKIVAVLLILSLIFTNSGFSSVATNMNSLADDTETTESVLLPKRIEAGSYSSNAGSIEDDGVSNEELSYTGDEEQTEESSDESSYNEEEESFEITEEKNSEKEEESVEEVESSEKEEEISEKEEESSGVEEESVEKIEDDNSEQKQIESSEKEQNENSETTKENNDIETTTSVVETEYEVTTESEVKEVVDEENQSEKLELKTKKSTESVLTFGDGSSHVHKVCGADADEECVHKGIDAHTELVTYEPLENTGDFPSEGRYYLTENLFLPEITVNPTGTIYICLNGKNISGLCFSQNNYIHEVFVTNCSHDEVSFTSASNWRMFTNVVPHAIAGHGRIKFYTSRLLRMRATATSESIKDVAAEFYNLWIETNSGTGVRADANDGLIDFAYKEVDLIVSKCDIYGYYFTRYGSSHNALFACLSTRRNYIYDTKFDNCGAQDQVLRIYSPTLFDGITMTGIRTGGSSNDTSVFYVSGIKVTFEGENIIKDSSGRWFICFTDSVNSNAEINGTLLFDNVYCAQAPTRIYRGTLRVNEGGELNFNKVTAEFILYNAGGLVENYGKINITNTSLGKTGAFWGEGNSSLRLYGETNIINCTGNNTVIRAAANESNDGLILAGRINLLNNNVPEALMQFYANPTITDTAEIIVKDNVCGGFLYYDRSGETSNLVINSPITVQNNTFKRGALYVVTGLLTITKNMLFENNIFKADCIVVNDNLTLTDGVSVVIKNNVMERKNADQALVFVGKKDAVINFSDTGTLEIVDNTLKCEISPTDNTLQYEYRASCMLVAAGGKIHVGSGHIKVNNNTTTGTYGDEEAYNHLFGLFSSSSIDALIYQNEGTKFNTNDTRIENVFCGFTDGLGLIYENWTKETVKNWTSKVHLAVFMPDTKYSPNLIVDIINDNVYLISESMIHEHKLCGYDVDTECDHEKIGSHTSTKFGRYLSSEGRPFPNNGTVYITEDLTDVGRVKVSGNLYLCLNGHSLSGVCFATDEAGGANVYITNCQRNEVNLTGMDATGWTNSNIAEAAGLYILAGLGTIHCTADNICDVYGTTAPTGCVLYNATFKPIKTPAAGSAILKMSKGSEFIVASVSMADYQAQGSEGNIFRCGANAYKIDLSNVRFDNVKANATNTFMYLRGTINLENLYFDNCAGNDWLDFVSGSKVTINGDLSIKNSTINRYGLYGESSTVNITINENAFVNIEDNTIGQIIHMANGSIVNEGIFNALNNTCQYRVIYTGGNCSITNNNIMNILNNTVSYDVIRMTSGTFANNKILNINNNTVSTTADYSLFRMDSGKFINYAELNVLNNKNNSTNTYSSLFRAVSANGCFEFRGTQKLIGNTVEGNSMFAGSAVHDVKTVFEGDTIIQNNTAKQGIFRMNQPIELGGKIDIVGNIAPVLLQVHSNKTLTLDGDINIFRNTMTNILINSIGATGGIILSKNLNVASNSQAQFMVSEGSIVVKESANVLFDNNNNSADGQYIRSQGADGIIIEPNASLTITNSIIKEGNMIISTGDVVISESATLNIENCKAEKGHILGSDKGSLIVAEAAKLNIKNNETKAHLLYISGLELSGKIDLTNNTLYRNDTTVLNQAIVHINKNTSSYGITLNQTGAFNVNNNSVKFDTQAASKYVSTLYISVGKKIKYAGGKMFLTDNIATGSYVDQDVYNHLFGVLTINTSGILEVSDGTTLKASDLLLHNAAFETRDGSGMLFANCRGLDYENIFTADNFTNPDLAIYRIEESLYINTEGVVHTHKICGATPSVACNHEGIDECQVVYYASNENDTSIPTGGSVFLEGDLVLSSAVTLTSNLYICTNGHNMQVVSFIGENYTVYITNCKHNETTITGSNNAQNNTTGVFAYRCSVQILGGASHFNLKVNKLIYDDTSVYDNNVFYNVDITPVTDSNIQYELIRMNVADKKLIFSKVTIDGFKRNGMHLIYYGNQSGMSFEYYNFVVQNVSISGGTNMINSNSPNCNHIMKNCSFKNNKKASNAGNYMFVFDSAALNCTLSIQGKNIIQDPRDFGQEFGFYGNAKVDTTIEEGAELTFINSHRRSLAFGKSQIVNNGIINISNSKNRNVGNEPLLMIGDGTFINNGVVKLNDNINPGNLIYLGAGGFVNDGDLYIENNSLTSGDANHGIIRKAGGSSAMQFRGNTYIRNNVLEKSRIILSNNGNNLETEIAGNCIISGNTIKSNVEIIAVNNPIRVTGNLQILDNNTSHYAIAIYSSKSLYLDGPVLIKNNEVLSAIYTNSMTVNKKLTIASNSIIKNALELLTAATTINEDVDIYDNTLNGDNSIVNTTGVANIEAKLNIYNNKNAGYIFTTTKALNINNELNIYNNESESTIFTTTQALNINGALNIHDNIIKTKGHVISSTAAVSFNGTPNIYNNVVTGGSVIYMGTNINIPTGKTLNIHDNSIVRTPDTTQAILHMSHANGVISDSTDYQGDIIIKDNKFNIATAGTVSTFISAVYIDGKQKINLGNGRFEVRDNITTGEYADIDKYSHGFGMLSKNLDGFMLQHEGTTFDESKVYIENIAFDNPEGMGVVRMSWNASDRYDNALKADTYTDPNMALRIIDSDLWIAGTNLPHKHKSCGLANDEECSDLTHRGITTNHESKFYASLKETDAFPTGGAIYLVASRSNIGNITLTSDLYLCLNGYGIDGISFSNTNSYTVFITNCQEQEVTVVGEENKYFNATGIVNIIAPKAPINMKVDGLYNISSSAYYTELYNVKFKPVTPKETARSINVVRNSATNNKVVLSDVEFSGYNTTVQLIYVSGSGTSCDFLNVNIHDNKFSHSNDFIAIIPSSTTINFENFACEYNEQTTGDAKSLFVLYGSNLTVNWTGNTRFTYNNVRGSLFYSATNTCRHTITDSFVMSDNITNYGFYIDSAFATMKSTFEFSNNTIKYFGVNVTSGTITFLNDSYFTNNIVDSADARSLIRVAGTIAGGRLIVKAPMYIADNEVLYQSSNIIYISRDYNTESLIIQAPITIENNKATAAIMKTDAYIYNDGFDLKFINNEASFIFNQSTRPSKFTGNLIISSNSVTTALINRESTYDFTLDGHIDINNNYLTGQYLVNNKGNFVVNEGSTVSIKNNRIKRAENTQVIFNQNGSNKLISLFENTKFEVSDNKFIADIEGDPSTIAAAVVLDSSDNLIQLYKDCYIYIKDNIVEGAYATSQANKLFGVYSANANGFLRQEAEVQFDINSKIENIGFKSEDGSGKIIDNWTSETVEGYNMLSYLERFSACRDQDGITFKDDNSVWIKGGRLHEDHYVCGATSSEICTHITFTHGDNLIDYQKLEYMNLRDALNAGGGNYYLSSDIIFLEPTVIEPAADLNICLNGFAVQNTKFRPREGVKLNITNCSVYQSDMVYTGSDEYMLNTSLYGIEADRIKVKADNITNSDSILYNIYASQNSKSAKSNPAITLKSGGAMENVLITKYENLETVVRLEDGDIKTNNITIKGNKTDKQILLLGSDNKLYGNTNITENVIKRTTDEESQALVYIGEGSEGTTYLYGDLFVKDNIFETNVVASADSKLTGVYIPVGRSISVGDASINVSNNESSGEQAEDETNHLYGIVSRNADGFIKTLDGYKFRASESDIYSVHIDTGVGEVTDINRYLGTIVDRWDADHIAGWTNVLHKEVFFVDKTIDDQLAVTGRIIDGDRKAIIYRAEAYYITFATNDFIGTDGNTYVPTGTMEDQKVIQEELDGSLISTALLAECGYTCQGAAMAGWKIASSSITDIFQSGEEYDFSAYIRLDETGRKIVPLQTIFEEQKYDVIFVDGGDISVEGSVPSVSGLYYYSSATMSEARFTKENHKFMYYAIDHIESKGEVVEDAVVNKDILYADEILTQLAYGYEDMVIFYKPVFIDLLATFTIAFVGNGASNTMESVQVVYVNDPVVPRNTFVRSGYRFIGFTKVLNGPVVYRPGDKFKEPIDIIDNVLVLYAKWEKGQEENYYSGGGDSSSSSTYVQQPTYTLLEQPILVGKNIYNETNNTILWTKTEKGYIAYRAEKNLQNQLVGYTPLTNGLYFINWRNKNCYYGFDIAGNMLKGFVTSGGKWYCLAPDGVYEGALTAGTLKYKGVTYQISATGEMLSPIVPEPEGTWVYDMDLGGYRIIKSLNPLTYVTGLYATYNSNGQIEMYYFNTNGVLQVGQLNINGVVYYAYDFGPNYGKIATEPVVNDKRTNPLFYLNDYQQVLSMVK